MSDDYSVNLFPSGDKKTVDLSDPWVAEESPSTRSQAFSSAYNETIQTQPFATLGRAAFRALDDSPVISEEDFNKKYAIQGYSPETSFKWKDGMKENTAMITHDLIMDRMQNQSMMQGHGGMQILGSLVGSIVDPLNTAAMFIPIGWIGRGAEVAEGINATVTGAREAFIMSKAIESTFWSRTGKAALQNSIGVAAVQAPLIMNAEADHTGYSYVDAAQNILFGGLIGAGFHAVGEGLGVLAKSAIERMIDGEINLDTAGNAIKALSSRSPTEGLMSIEMQDLARMDKTSVMEDLRASLKREPTEVEIDAETKAREITYAENKSKGLYEPAVTEQPTQDLTTTQLADQVRESQFKGDDEKASESMKALSQKVEQENASILPDSVREEIAKPIEIAEKSKSLWQEFSDCVAGATESIVKKG